MTGGETRNETVLSVADERTSTSTGAETRAAGSDGVAPTLGHAEGLQQPAAAVSAAILLGFAVIALGVVGIKHVATLLQVLTLLGVLAASGLAAFELLVHDGAGGPLETRLLERARSAAALLGVAATVGGWWLHVAEYSGRGWPGLFDAEAGRIVAGHSLTASAALRVVGLSLLVSRLHRRSRRSEVNAALLAIGALVAVGSFLFQGHAATSEPRLLVLIADFLHTSTAALWFGGLLGLVIVFRNRQQRDTASVASCLARYSTAMALTTAVVAASGLTLAIRHLDTLENLASGYGIVLIAKALIVAPVAAAGAFNHFVLVPAVTESSDEARRYLSMTIRAELAGLIVVVVLTGVLVGMTPG